MGHFLEVLRITGIHGLQYVVQQSDDCMQWCMCKGMILERHPLFFLYNLNYVPLIPCRVIMYGRYYYNVPIYILLTFHVNFV